MMPFFPRPDAAVDETVADHLQLFTDDRLLAVSHAGLLCAFHLELPV